ncbi:trypsin-like peptidase domain-containing protein [Arthrobacter sp. TMN-49]
MGYPNDQPIGIADGIVSGLDRKFPTDFGLREHLVQTSAPINQGNSGGPLVDMAGNVIGVVSEKSEITKSGRPVENMAYAVAPSAARPTIGEWMNLDTTIAAVKCASAVEPCSLVLPVVVGSNELEAINVAQALLVHRQAINCAAYDSAFSYFAASTKGAFGGAGKWSEGLGASF